MNKKNVAAKSAKKVVAPSLVKAPKSKKVIKVDSKTFTKGGVVFEVSAVIPTQLYGNIQPKIQVICNTIEEGRAMVMPVIEQLYQTYAEAPLNGRECKFLGKISETVKTVAPAPTAPATTPKPVQEQDTPAPVAQDVPVPQATASTAPAKPKSEPVMKAEKALSLAMTEDAAIAIQDQIEKSVKIAAEDKPALLVLCINKRNELKKKSV